MGGISCQTGKLVFITKPKFFNQHDTVEFLKQVRASFASEKLVLFWDNCSIHKTKLVSEAMAQLGIEAILNVPYCPQFNGIELVWARAKREFRAQALTRKIEGARLPLKQVVPEILESVENEYNLKCAGNSLRVLGVEYRAKSI